MTAPVVESEKKGPLGAFAPFTKPFWVINGVELFERGAYYGMLAILSTFLLSELGAPAWLRGVLLAVQFPLLYFLPVVSGALADKFGYKKLLFVTFGALIAGYATLSVSQDLQTAFAGILLYSIGAGLFKPMPAAVVTDTTTEKDRNFGFAIYYWMINLGAFLAPLGMQQVFGGDLRPYFLVSAALSALNLVIILVAWRDLKPAQPSIRVGQSLARIGEIRKHPAFMVLLIIYSGFWFMYAITTSFMQNYATQYGILTASTVALLVPANALAILIVGPVISKLTGKMPALPLMIAGITIFCAGFLLVGFVPTLIALFAGVFIYSIGEFLTHPSYLSYVSKISPSDKVPLFFGFGFLPIGVGQMLGTLSGGFLYGRFAEEMGRPQLFWVSIISVGLVTVAALLIYNMVLLRRGVDSPAPSPRPRRFGAAPFLATAAVLLIPALVVAGTVVETPEGEGLGTASTGAGLGSVLQLPDLKGDVEEGKTIAHAYTAPANVAGVVTLNLTWVDEAAGGPGAANAPDSFKLQVMRADGTEITSEVVANEPGQEGRISLVLQDVQPNEVFEVTIHSEDCGDVTTNVGPLPLPGQVGGRADTGNAVLLTAAAEVA